MSGYLRDSQLRRQLEEKVKEATRTRQAAEDGLKAARETLDAARRIDADVREAEKPLAEAEAAMGSKDYKLAADKAGEAEERGKRIYRDRVKSVVDASGTLTGLARGVGADSSEAQGALAKAQAALDGDDLATAIDLAKKAWKRSEKVLSEHLSSSFSRAQALILSAKNLGRDVAPVEDLLSRARTAMENNDFQSALDFTREGLDTITDDLGSVLEKDVREAEDLMRTAQELGADVTKATNLIERARGDIQNLDFEKARNALRQSRAESEKALQRTLDGKIADFSTFTKEAQALGADTAAAQERFSKAEGAIRQGNYKDGANLAKEGFQALQQAQFQVVVQKIAGSREKFVAAANMNLDIRPAIDALNKSREALQRKAFKEALDWAKKADESVESVVGRYRSAEERLRELHRAFAESEALGVTTATARRAAERAREAYQSRDPAALEGTIDEAFNELRKAEHDRAMQAIEQVEFILTLGERNGADLAEADKALQEGILAAKGQEYRKALELTNRGQVLAEAALQKSLADGMTVLRGALPHLGDDAGTLKVLVNRAEAAMASRDYDGAFGALEEGRRTVEARTKASAERTVEALGAVVRMGLELGLDVKEVEDLHRELNGVLGAGRAAEVLAARDRSRALLSKVSEDLLNAVKNVVAQARDLKIDIEEMKDLLKRSKMAFSVEDYAGGLALLQDCHDRAKKATAVHRQTQTAIASAAALAAEARKRDVDVSKVLEVLLEAKRAFEHLDYEKALELAAKARAETEKLMVLYTSAQKVLSSRERMELAGRLGIDAPHLREILTEAKEAMKGKDYETALQHAERCEKEITSLITDKVAGLLSGSEALLGSIQGVNLALVNEEIVKARQALDQGKIASAADAALRLQERLEKLKKQGEEADASVRRVRDVLADVEAMNVEAPATARLLDQAERAYKMGQFEETLDHVAQAEAEVVKERDQGIASIMNRLQESIDRAKRDGTDTRSAERMFDKAREFLRGRKYRQALAIAMQSEGEAERVALQQGMASQALQTVERKLQSLGLPAPGAKGMAETARKAFSEGDYVRALDTAIKANDALADARMEMEEAEEVRGRVQALLRTAQSIGADPSRFESIFREGETAREAGDFGGAKAAYAQSLDWGIGAMREHLEAALAGGEQDIAACKRLGIPPTPFQNKFAQARTYIEAEDFEGAAARIREGVEAARQALGGKLHEAMTQAADNLAHAKKLGSDAREAEEMLRKANERGAQREYEGALDLVNRALERVESVKIVEKRFIDLTYKAESTIRNGKKFGIDMRAAEKRLAQSIELRRTDLAEAIRTAEDAYRVAWEAVETFAPSLEGTLDVGPARLNEWTEATLRLTNTGKGLAKDVRVKILGDAETAGLKDLVAVRAKGTESLAFRLKMTASGSVPLAIQIISHRVFDDKEYTREMIAQVEVAEVAQDKAKKLTADLETRCPICKGLIKKGFKVLQCACGRDFHELCASRVGRCPVCFRSLGIAE